MKKPFIILFLTVFAFSTQAQGEMAFFDQIVKKQYDQAAQFFDREINLCILDFEGMVTKSDATGRVRNFFKNHPPVSYSVSHNGQSKGGQSNYYVIRMETARGAFRLFAYFDKVGSGYKISEFRIEP